MKLVMTYTEGDGCTYSCDQTFPFEYESAEAALVEFDRLFEEAVKGNGRFSFCGLEFYTTTFIERNSVGINLVYLPDFFTLEEWFDKNRLN